MSLKWRYHLISHLLDSSPKISNHIEPPRPLLFDRVSEGRPKVSTCRFLSLPSELLASIIQYLPSTSLASLALVNPDCQQLARCHQFATIKLDYSDQSVQLIRQLQAEACERSDSNGATKVMPLGPCIRRLNVLTQPMYMKQRHEVDLDDEYQVLTDEQRQNRTLAACKFYFDWYVPLIQSLIANRTALPNLQFLEWHDKVCLEPVFWDAVTNSTLRHFKIKGAFSSTRLVSEGSHRQQLGFWPLQSLHLDIHHFDYAGPDQSSLLCTSILHACAPTLESLTWNAFSNGYIQTDGLGPSPPFPNLRHLKLESVSFVDTAILKELVHDGLISLDVTTTQHSACSTFFADRGQISRLETVVWRHTALVRESPSWNFLHSNPQIQKLWIQGYLPAEYLEQRVLPDLISHFYMLKSLSLQWDGDDIPQQSLVLTCSLLKLEHLAMSVSGECYWLTEHWINNHTSRRKHLRNLQQLKTLIFGGDFFRIGTTTGGDRYHDIDNYVTFEERRHQVILEQAMEYAEVLPQLDWIDLGQLLVTFEYNSDGTRFGRPLPLHEDNSGYPPFDDLFGRKSV